MGCDIHPHVERRVNGQWERVPDAPEAISNRNYDVFAILANVRNGYGFAGVPTGSGMPFISEPRGLPADMAQPLAAGLPYKSSWMEKYPEDAEHYRDDYGDHSFSWVTLRELLDFDWSRVVVKTGVVTRAQYDQWDHSTPPTTYCGGVSGGGIKVGRYDDPASLVGATHVSIDWNETCAECAHAFHSTVLPWLIEQGKPNDVRLVFGFDS